MSCQRGRGGVLKEAGQATLEGRVQIIITIILMITVIIIIMIIIMRIIRI